VDPSSSLEEKSGSQVDTSSSLADFS